MEELALEAAEGRRAQSGRGLRRRGAVVGLVLGLAQRRAWGWRDKLWS